MKLTDIKGIGQKRAELLEDIGIVSLDAALSYFPVDYIDATNPVKVSDLTDGERASVSVEVIAEPSVFYKGKMSIVSVKCADESGKITLRWYNQPYRSKQIHLGDRLYATGRVIKNKGMSMANPLLCANGDSITPVYSICKGLSQTIIKQIIRLALDSQLIMESLPKEILDRYGLMSKKEAVSQLHLPTTTSALKQAQRRLQFEETLIYMLVVEHQKDARRQNNGIAFDTTGLLEKFLKRIPFTPTDAQLKVLKEVDKDLSQGSPMNRLIQGDVGSGKTLIAEYALTVAAANGYQGAFMAPTEILARQHYQTLTRLFGSTCCLLLGSQNAVQRREILEKLRSGTCFIVVGTHAILSETVVFEKLGVVITDEQHRFGVSQRAKLSKKGMHPDTLVMSATPIPRTLALILYGDLDLSVIDSLPPGRKEVKTRLIAQGKRNDLYRYLHDEALKGNQSYVVCPLIEPTEQSEGVSAVEMYESLTKQYKGIIVGLLHGRMKEQQKNDVMESFKRGEISVLVSTTVIEVGIDVENATNMVIESANRFGLATLHQLRGRVGRGKKQSYCFLLSDGGDSAQTERIQAMLSTSDGFELAERDMQLRGSGDILGLRQHGEKGLQTAWSNIPVEVLHSASQAAADILERPTAANHELVERALERFYQNEQIVMN